MSTRDEQLQRLSRAYVDQLITNDLLAEKIAKQRASDIGHLEAIRIAVLNCQGVVREAQDGRSSDMGKTLNAVRGYLETIGANVLKLIPPG